MKNPCVLVGMGKRAKGIRAMLGWRSNVLRGIWGDVSELWEYMGGVFDGTTTPFTIRGG